MTKYREYMWLREDDGFVSVDEMKAEWPWKVKCPVCGERLAMLKDDVTALTFDYDEGDERGWWAACPACNTALDVFAGRGLGQDMTPQLVPHCQ